MPGKNLSIKELELEVSDLTKKLEEANLFCKNSREKFEKALLACPDPVCIIDLETFNIVDLNNNVEKEFGYSRKEAIGKTPPPD